MDKFAQISLDFFNQPSTSNGKQEPGHEEPSVPSNIELREQQPPAHQEPETLQQSAVPVDPGIPRQPPTPEEPEILQQPTIPEEPELLPGPNYIGAPSNELVSMLTDDDHPDIIDFTILGEKDVSYDQQELVAKSTRGRKSLKSFDRTNGHPEIPSDDILNQKQYYSIGEVAVMFRVNPSLLRFWEAEFDIIQPRKNKKGDRHFRPIDIRNLELIYDLLRRRKLTIEGAREYLKQNSRAKERYDTIQSLQKIRSFLLELKANL